VRPPSALIETDDHGVAGGAGVRERAVEVVGESAGK
jgi:hypothetical protein